MSKEAVFTLKLESDLRDAFMKEAAESHRPASQIVRDFMSDFVRKKKEQREYDTWLDADLDRAIAAADHPKAKWIPHEDVVADMERQRQSFLKRLAENPDAE